MKSFGKAAGFGILIWIVGFAWGSLVFMTPALKGLASIPYVSRYPAISFPLLVVFPFLALWFANICLAGSADRAAAGQRVGIIFAGTNLLLDLLVLVLAFKGGIDYFASVSVWLGYAILLLVPWWAGRRVARAS